jgi:pSer/pThr/pTyr-binding forkhead associated (FHA) protein
LLIAAVLMHRQVIATVRLTAQRLTEAMPGVFGPARGRLVITRGAAAGREYRLVKAVTILGREQALCDIALEDRFVSARHATIRLDAHGNFAMTDEGSQNGTLVNGVRIPPRQLIPLPFDSTIRLGETEMVLRQTGAAPMAHPG